MRRIVVIEDDPGISAVYKQLLGPHYSMSFAGDIGSAFELLSGKKSSCDLVIADLCLPDGAFNLVSKSDEWQPIVKRYPFLVVSVIDDLNILETCLQSWAEDYLVKPFNNNELLVKCKNLIASRPALTLDNQNMVLVFDELMTEELTAKEFKMLAHMLEQSEWRCEAASLLKAVWGQEAGIQRLHTGLSRLRGKLRPLGIEISSTADGFFSLRTPERS